MTGCSEAVPRDPKLACEEARGLVLRVRGQGCGAQSGEALSMLKNYDEG